MTTVVLTPVVISSALTAEQVVDLMTSEHQWMTSSIVKEPLVGIVNGRNKTFSLSATPATFISVTDYQGNALTVALSDGESGSVILENAPVNTVFATYTNTVVKPSAVNGIATGAVALMETLYPRGYSMVNSGGTLYLSSSSGSVTDDVIAPSQVQRRFVGNCVFYVWVRSYYLEATMHAIAFREQRASGLQVDRTKQAAAYNAMLELARQNVEESMYAAMAEAGDDNLGALAGGLVPGRTTSVQPHSGWYNDTVFPYPWA
jgi:hypothetical protein